MSSYIFIKNFYLEELQTLIQDHFNSIYTEESNLEAEILMKNSRSFFIQFNEDLAIEELLDWMNIFLKNKPNNDRVTIIEGYLDMNDIQYKFYSLNEDLYAINTKNETFKIEDLEELISIENNSQQFTSTEIPSKNLHRMKVIRFEKPKKKWWKFW